MAKPAPPVYARVRTDHGAYGAYARAVEDSGLKVLDLIGRRAARNARSLMTRRRSGASAKSISYKRTGKVVGVTVGTMAGAVHEFGRGPGKRGGPIPALGFLRRGMGDAMGGHLGDLRSELQARKVRAKPGRKRRA